MEVTPQVVFALVLFLAAYAFIITEKIHRTIIAVVAAAAVVVFGILDQAKAIEYVDFNTIGLLTGMMIIVGITKDTGLFEFLAISAVKAAKGRPMQILIWLSALTAFISAFLDNVTCILLFIPVTLSIAKKLNINPVPIIFSEVILANIGGTATLIGDPPNIMIGSAAGLGFNDFVRNLAPVIIVISVVTLALLYLIFRKQLKSSGEAPAFVMELNPGDEIKDKSKLKKSVIVILITVIGFILHQQLHLESGTIAMCGAALLLILVRPDPVLALRTVEWPVIFFFVGLFILVGGLNEVGIIRFLAQQAVNVTGGEMVPTGMSILWVSAIVSAFIDNIPFTATMIPFLQQMGEIGQISNINALWWSISLGVCLGGNGTLIGASANVVAVGMLEERGHKLSFLSFMAKGFPLMIVSILISMVYLYFFQWT